MILETHPFWQDKLRLEIVNGKEVVETYEDTTYVASCQSIYENAHFTEMLALIPNYNLIRVMNKHNEVMLRCARWHTTTGLKILGPVYADYNYDGVESIRGIKTEFRKISGNYGVNYGGLSNIDITLETHFVAVDLRSYEGPWPTVDVFPYMNTTKTKLSNKRFPHNYYDLCDYECGELIYCSSY